MALVQCVLRELQGVFTGAIVSPMRCKWEPAE